MIHQKGECIKGNELVTQLANFWDGSEKTRKFFRKISKRFEQMQVVFSNDFDISFILSHPCNEFGEVIHGSTVDDIKKFIMTEVTTVNDNASDAPFRRTTFL